MDFDLPGGDDWPAQPVAADCFQEPGYKVAVQFRPKTEQLYPASDAGLPSFVARMTRDGDQSGAALVQHVSAVDRIDVHVASNVEDADILRFASPETERLTVVFVDVASRAAVCLLNICRALSGSVTIQPLPREWSIKHNKTMLLCPWSITWLDTSEPGTMQILGSQWQPGAVKSPVTGTIPFRHVAQALQQGEAPLVGSLLVEAEAHLQAGRLREAVISAATATEVASNLYIEQQGLQGEPRCAAMREGRGAFSGTSFAERRYHLIPELRGRSLKTEFPELFASLEQLYRARNSFAHRGSSSGVDLTAAMQLLGDSSKAVAWLQQQGRLKSQEPRPEAGAPDEPLG